MSISRSFRLAECSGPVGGKYDADFLARARGTVPANSTKDHTCHEQNLQTLKSREATRLSIISCPRLYAMASQQQLSSREVEEKMFSPRKNLMPRRKGQPTQNVAAAAQSVVVGDLSAEDTAQRQQALELLAQPEPQGLSKSEFKESTTTTTTTQPLEFQQPARRPSGHDFKPAAPALQVASEPCEYEPSRQSPRWHVCRGASGEAYHERSVRGGFSHSVPRVR
jgi:hypothetical protein